MSQAINFDQNDNLLAQLLSETVQLFADTKFMPQVHGMSDQTLHVYLTLVLRSSIVNRLFQNYATALCNMLANDDKLSSVLNDFVVREETIKRLAYIKLFYPAVYHSFGKFGEQCSDLIAQRVAVMDGNGTLSLQSLLSEFESHHLTLTRVMLSSRQKLFETDISRPVELLDSLLALEGCAFVTGPEFSGKTHFVSQYLSCFQDSVINSYLITVDRTTDLVSLLGNYVIRTNEKEAQFEWKEGAFVKAIREGKLCILENFELASDQLKSFISSVVSSRSLKIRNKNVFFHRNFRLIVVSRETDQKHVDKSIVFERLSFDQLLGLSLRKHKLGEPAKLLISQLCLILNKEGDANYSFHKISKFVVRTADFLRTLGIATSERLFLASNSQCIILLSVVELFFENSPTDFFNSGVFEPICTVFGLKSASAAPMVQAYETYLKLEGKTLKTMRFSAVLPNPSSFSPEFVITAKTSHLIESIFGCVLAKENVLLVGETGCGKTTVVQELAKLFGKRLNVFNLSHSTDAFDLFGGYRPVDQDISFRHQIDQIQTTLNDLYSIDKNQAFLASLRDLLANKNYVLLAKGLVQASTKVINSLNDKLNAALLSQTQLTQVRPSEHTKAEIEKLTETKERFQSIINKNKNFLSSNNTDKKSTQSASSSLNLEFIKGIILQSIERNEWLLLDEINLANEEVLFRLYQILFDDKVFIPEAAEFAFVRKHPEFRLFACMNPAFEVGKKPLPKRIKEGFTTINVSPIDSVEEVFVILKDFFSAYQMVSSGQLMKLAEFYCKLREGANKGTVLDKHNKKIVFTMRQLRRATQVVKEALRNQNVLLAPVQAIYVGVRLAFYLDLNESSKAAFNTLFGDHFGVKSIEKSYLERSFYRVGRTFEEGGEYLFWQDFPIRKAVVRRPNSDSQTQTKSANIVITPNIRTIICDLMRILLYDTSQPILLEGPTSVGKTSIVVYLASLIGQKVVRLNNHRDTDVDEYIGSYVPDHTGKIVFQEGVLLQCMREGAWLLLDELNLARSEILEALNRVLDDNQELFVPELDKMVKPAPGFRVFATQNPNSYSGRSLLSTAFRNRFIVVNFESHDVNDLKSILMAKESVPETRAKVMMQIMTRLETMRSVDKVFEGKEGLITIRDLLKWGSRHFADVSFKHLAQVGYYLLGERVREPVQKRVIKKIISDEAAVSLPDDHKLYNDEFQEYQSSMPKLQTALKGFNLELNTQFKRLFCLTVRAFENREPVLLIGPTGCGKTTLAQLLAQIKGVPFYSINCHKHTEVSDFLGGWKPLRGKETLLHEAKEMIVTAAQQDVTILPESIEIGDIEVLVSKIEHRLSPKQAERLSFLTHKLKSEFEWIEGSLVEAVRSGGLYLIDEISLASDSVLERLNSLLEATRELSLQQGNQDYVTIPAHKQFFILATMNPSGDYGKRELSPALRNRFTEIWATSVLDADNFQTDLQKSEVMTFLQQFSYTNLQRLIRQSEWVNFEGSLSRFLSYLIDLFTMINSKYQEELKPLNMRDLATMCHLFGKNWHSIGDRALFTTSCVTFETLRAMSGDEELAVVLEADFVELHQRHFGLRSVSLPVDSSPVWTDGNSLSVGGVRIEAVNGHVVQQPVDYLLEEPHVKQNLFRLLLGLQSGKPVLIEGNPGTGKTSLIETLGKTLGATVYRINLSEQTDLIDLLGSHVPDQENCGLFVWNDGLLLRALKEGAWIIFDELNLANQTILEGLNSILDHRGDVFLPDLNATVAKKDGFRFFGCQNSTATAKNRKSLPASFLNRFFKIYTSDFSSQTLSNIVQFMISFWKADSPAARFAIQYLFDIVNFSKSSQFGQPTRLDLRSFIRILKFCKQLTENSSNSQQSQHALILSKLVHDTFLTGQFGIAVKSEFYKAHPIYQEIQGISLRFGSALNGPERDSEGQFMTLCCFDDKQPGQALHSEFLGSVFHVETQPIKHLSKLLFSLSCSLELSFPVLFDCVSRTEVIGVTSLIEAMSRSKGSKLRSLLLYKSADISDLIGNYEQCNWEVVFKRLVGELKKHQIATNTASKLSGLSKQSVVQMTLSLQQQVSVSNTLSFTQKSKMLSRLQTLTTLIEHEKSIFLWSFSPLLKAIIKGDWLVIKGCEQANSAVLEKLNGILESDSFIVNECFDESGNVLKVLKNTAFRIFFVFDQSMSATEAGKGVQRTVLPTGLQSRCFTVKSAEFFDSQVDSKETLTRTQVSLLLQLKRLKVYPNELIDNASEDHLCNRQSIVKLATNAIELRSNKSLVTDLQFPALLSGTQVSGRKVTNWQQLIEHNVVKFLRCYLKQTEAPTPTQNTDSVTCLASQCSTASIMKQLLNSLETVFPNNNWSQKLPNQQNPIVSLLLLNLLSKRAELDADLVHKLLVSDNHRFTLQYLRDCDKSVLSMQQNAIKRDELSDYEKLLEMLSVRFAVSSVHSKRLYTTSPENNDLYVLLASEHAHAIEQFVNTLSPTLTANFNQLATQVLQSTSQSSEDKTTIEEALFASTATVSEANQNRIVLLNQVVKAYLQAINSQFQSSFDHLSANVFSIFDEHEDTRFSFMIPSDQANNICLSYLINRPRMLLTKFDKYDEFMSQTFPNIAEFANLIRPILEAKRWVEWRSPRQYHKYIQSALKQVWKTAVSSLLRTERHVLGLKFSIREFHLLQRLTDHLLKNMTWLSTDEKQSATKTDKSELLEVNRQITSQRVEEKRVGAFMFQKELFLSCIKTLLKLENDIYREEIDNVESTMDKWQSCQRTKQNGESLAQAGRQLTNILDWCFRGQLLIETSTVESSNLNALIGEAIMQLVFDRLSRAGQVSSERLNDKLQSILQNAVLEKSLHLKSETADFLFEVFASSEHLFNVHISDSVLGQLSSIVKGNKFGNNSSLSITNFMTANTDRPFNSEIALFEHQFNPLFDSLIATQFKSKADASLTKISQSIDAMKERYKSEIKSTGLSQAAKQIRLQEQLDRVARYEYTAEAVQANRIEREEDFRETFNLGTFGSVNESSETQTDKESLLKITRKYNKFAADFWANSLIALAIGNGLKLKSNVTVSEYILEYLKLNHSEIGHVSDTKLLESWTVGLCQGSLKKKQSAFKAAEIEVPKRQTFVSQTILDFFTEQRTVSLAFNFYEPTTDRRPFERFLSLLNDLMTKIAPFHSDPMFSELSSLNQLIKSCKTVSDMEINSSLANLCTAIELLLRAVEEFNVALPETLKLKSESGALKQQLLELRRQEKHKWKDFVLIKKIEFMNEDFGETISKLAIVQSDLSCSSKVLFCEDLLHSSKLLTFDQRLILLLYVSSDLAKTSPVVATTLRNLLFFYASYHSEVKAKTKALQPEIEEPMKTSMKLMNWHFEDLVNLKMNVEKLYRGIHRTVKKQREVLETPVKAEVILAQRNSVLFASIGEAHANFQNAIFAKTKTGKSQQQKVIKKTEFTTALQSSSDFRACFKISDLSLLKLLSASKLYRLFGVKEQPFVPKFKGNLLFKDELGQLMKDYLTRMEALKEEKKRTFVARALLDFTTELSSFGLKSRFNYQTKQTNAKLFELMQFMDVGSDLPNAIKDNSLEDEMASKMEKANLRLCRIVDMLKTFTDTTTYGQDLTPDVRDKLVSFCFGLYVKLCEHTVWTKRIMSATASVCDREQSVSRMRKMAINKAVYLIDSNLELAKTEHQLTAKQCTFLTELRTLLTADKVEEAALKLNNCDHSTGPILAIKELTDSILGSATATDNYEKTEQSLSRSRSLLLLKLSKLKESFTKDSNQLTNYFDLQLSILKALSAYCAVVTRNTADTSVTGKRLSFEMSVLLVHAVDWTYKLSKFVYLTCLVFTNLVYRGFCLPKESETEEQPQDGRTEFKSGTGVGEGQGTQNVTAEMEYEEQVLGTKGDAPEDQEDDDFESPDPLGKDEEEMEMENDFEGRTDRRKEGEDQANDEQDGRRERQEQDEFTDVDERQSDLQLFQDEKDSENAEEQLSVAEDLELEAKELGEREQTLQAAKKEKEDARTLDKEGVQAKEEDELEGEPMEIESQEADGDQRDGQEEFKDDLPEMQEEDKEDKMSGSEMEIEAEDLDQGSFDEEPQHSDALGDGQELIEEESIVEDGNGQDEAQVTQEQPEEPKAEEENEEGLKQERQQVVDFGVLGAQQNTSNQQNYSNAEQRQEEEANQGTGAQQKTEKEQKKMQNFQKQLQKLFKEKVKVKESEVKRILDKIELIEPQTNTQKDQLKEEQNEFQKQDEKTTFEPESQEDNNKPAEFGTKNLNFDIKDRIDNLESDNEETDKNGKEKQHKRTEYSEPIENTDLGKRDIDASANNVDSDGLKRVKPSDHSVSQAIQEYSRQPTSHDSDAHFDKQRQTVTLENHAHMHAEKHKLCEELKSILEQKKMADLKGDYRTGKRLNMKRVISYIASNYRKDKIWLRRTDPSQTNYRILIGVDDSSSMRLFNQ